jgi:hypothetical protein
MVVFIVSLFIIPCAFSITTTFQLRLNCASSAHLNACANTTIPRQPMCSISQTCNALPKLKTSQYLRRKLGYFQPISLKKCLFCAAGISCFIQHLHITATSPLP